MDEMLHIHLIRVPEKEKLVKDGMINNGCQFSRTGENHESTNLEARYILSDKLKKKL